MTSYTRFASDLKENDLHAMISGFTVGNTPGAGTFYDFHKRLWLSDKNNLSDSLHPPKFKYAIGVKPKKPKGKEEKAAPVEKITVEELFLPSSAGKGLISLKELALAGDGTPVYTAAQQRKTRTCKCLEQGIRDCKCSRIYHQPDCDIGWDFHRNHYYFGYG